MKLDLPSRIQRTLVKGSGNLSGRFLTKQISYIIDSTINGLFRTLDEEYNIEDRICLIAIGGYGRMELAPHSDIDLLYLHDNVSEDLLKIIISKINNFLYDSGMQVGHTCRTVEESKDYIDNMLSFYAILDSRYLIGSENLFLRYQTEFLENLPIDLVIEYNNRKFQSLEESILLSHTPLLLTEPNIKNGPLGLRDIQAIYWIEKTIKDSGKSTKIGIFDFFTQGDTLGLVQAYDFFLRTRVSLHMISGRKNDRMDLSYQPIIAEALGFGPKGLSSVEAFVSTYYKYQKDTYHYIGHYLDSRKFKPSVKEFSKINDHGINLFISEKYLYPPKTEKLFTNPDKLYQDMVLIFQIAQEKNLEPSPSLINEMKFAANFLDDDFKNNKQVIEVFLKILRNNKNVGRLLTLMHESNVLGKIFPEFGACTNFPLFSFHHQYPVDEHSLLILRELDLLVNAKFEDTDVQKIFNECNTIYILYLAILIHDAGKVKEGDHCQYGAELASAISERIGLNHEESDLFRFLVEHHIVMSELSNKRDIFDPSLILEFSNLVQDNQRLSLLYVLTIIDTKSVGPGILTYWKKDILFQLYQSTRNAIIQKNTQLDSFATSLSNLKNYLISKENLDIKTCDVILEFASTMKPSSYLSYNTYRRILHHFTQLLTLKKAKSESNFEIKIHFHIEFEKEPSFTTITVYSIFRKDIMMHIASSVSSLDLNLVGMRPFRFKDDLDDLLITQCQITDSMGSGDIPINTLNLLKKTIESTLNQEISLDEVALVSRNWSDRGEPIDGMVDEMVTFINNPNDAFTILEIRLPDSIGLLYRILAILNEFEIELLFARIATSADFTFDTFYVIDSKGNKLIDPILIAKIRDRIYQASDLAWNSKVVPTLEEIYF
jgi:[protein-PII] uridylyltransferase